MHFSVTYAVRNPSEATTKRSLQLFASWQPPKGYDIKSHYALADGSGGVSVVEANSAAAMLEALSPWQPFFEFRAVPIIEIENAVPVFQAVVAWRESVR